MFLIQKLSILIFRKEILYLGYYEYGREKIGCFKIPESKCFAPEIEPDDIDVSDTVAFTWEIQ